MLPLSRATLVIVDLQNDFVRQGAPMEVPGVRATLPPVQKLIAAARAAAWPVIYTKFVAGPCRTLLWNWSPQMEQFGVCQRRLKRRYADLSEERLCADVVDEIHPQPHDYVVDKYGYSAFHNTNLSDILASEGRDTIVVVGTVTHICVAETVHDGFAQGLKVVVASDCVTSLAPDLQAAFLKNFALKFGYVATSDEILAAIAGTRI